VRNQGIVHTRIVITFDVEYTATVSLSQNAGSVDNIPMVCYPHATPACIHAAERAAKLGPGPRKQRRKAPFESPDPSEKRILVNQHRVAECVPTGKGDKYKSLGNEGVWSTHRRATGEALARPPAPTTFTFTTSFSLCGRTLKLHTFYLVLCALRYGSGVTTKQIINVSNLIYRRQALKLTQVPTALVSLRP